MDPAIVRDHQRGRMNPEKQYGKRVEIKASTKASTNSDGQHWSTRQPTTKALNLASANLTCLARFLLTNFSEDSTWIQCLAELNSFGSEFGLQLAL